jgi:O-antigen/teichoic acid export membrane protein
MIASLLVDAVVYTTASHITARSRYRAVTTDRRIWREALAYSLPLTLNGIGLAASSQLDRALVSRWFGVATLALYSVVLNLAVVPSNIIGSVLSLFSMSLLTQMSAGEERADRNYQTVFWAHAVAAVAYAIAVATTLDLLAPIVYGGSYTVGASTVAEPGPLCCRHAGRPAAVDAIARNDRMGDQMD